MAFFFAIFILIVNVIGFVIAFVIVIVIVVANSHNIHVFTYSNMSEGHRRLAAPTALSKPAEGGKGRISTLPTSSRLALRKKKLCESWRRWKR